MQMNLRDLITNLREKIEASQKSNPFDFEVHSLERIDDFLSMPECSDLEKAFYLILNEFPNDSKDYIINPRQMVLVPDIYDSKVPGIEYEIDFALFGGSINDPVKVAIECDGLRSHGHKHSRKDRRKDINLQAAGWLVMRFTSKEIHDELLKYHADPNYSSDFLYSIENVLAEKLKLVTGNNFARNDYRTKLTGYKWSTIKCTICGFSQSGILNKRKHVCNKCGEKFIIEIVSSETIVYESNGLLFFA